jgi:hypothetical protein
LQFTQHAIRRASTVAQFDRLPSRKTPSFSGKIEVCTYIRAWIEIGLQWINPLP